MKMSPTPDWVKAPPPSVTGVCGYCGCSTREEGHDIDCEFVKARTRAWATQADKPAAIRDRLPPMKEMEVGGPVPPDGFDILSKALRLIEAERDQERSKLVADLNRQINDMATPVWGVTSAGLADMKESQKSMNEMSHGARDHFAEKYPVTGSAGRKDEPGLRFDSGKSRIDLIPPEFIEALGDHYRVGALKYAERNWEKGMSWSRCYNSAMRHMLKFWGGEEIDDETGTPHMICAAWNMAALHWYTLNDVGTDDRSVTA